MPKTQAGSVKVEADFAVEILAQDMPATTSCVYSASSHSGHALWWLQASELVG